MTITRLLKEAFPGVQKMGAGAGSSVLISNIIGAESQEIQFRGIKVAAMLAIGSFIINCVKSSINAESVCKNLCSALEITKNPNDILGFAKHLFSGDTSKDGLDKLMNAHERVSGHSVPRQKKEKARFVFGNATLTLRFLSLLTEDSASMLLGYTLLHSLGLNYYAKEFGASFTQTFFTTVFTAGTELVSEQLSLWMRK